MPDSPNERVPSTPARREAERAVSDTAAWTVAVVARAIEDARAPR